MSPGGRAPSPRAPMLLKARLMTPGPTAMAESTRLAMAAATPHHRTTAFADTLREVLEHLRWLWETEDDGDVLVVAGSGTTGMEAAMGTVLAPGDRVAIVRAGKFGERWQALAQLLGCEVVEIPRPWGHSVTAEDVRRILGDEAPVQALVVVASETSTGALQPVPEIAAALRAHSPDALVLVDGITAVGCVDLSMRRHSLDVLVSGSQKAFGLPPGAAFVGMGPRAWARAGSIAPRGMALDLRRERKQSASGQTAFTPAISLVVGAHEVMTRWREMGRDTLLEHADMLSTACLAAARALGLEPFATDLPSPALTSIAVPPTLDGAKLVARMREQYGTHVAGGQDQLKGRILRIGHLGAVDPFDLLQALCALELALHEAGHPVRLGAGVAAAQEALAPWMRQATPSTIHP
ncbi:MAG: alanine--glyoxylate aminotransferase family protein [Deltaproteobacteria bacterium]|nr:MAG: alanine--glyoxylate aminotransferase family protein [Deltaproteobacteria bacterium]